jgi:hypothetical protein
MELFSHIETAVVVSKLKLVSLLSRITTCMVTELQTNQELIAFMRVQTVGLALVRRVKTTFHKRFNKIFERNN